MNIEVANRLQQLRKAKGLSQEELAQILGLSRQAISKWERAETSPDTDNLVCLARLYNISIDKLLDTNESMEEIKERIAQERINEIDKDKEEPEDTIETIEEEADIVEEDITGLKDEELNDEEEKLKEKRDRIENNITFASLILGVFLFIFLGYNYNAWSWSWAFIFVPVFIELYIVSLVKRDSSISNLIFAILFVWIIVGGAIDDSDMVGFVFAITISGILIVQLYISIITYLVVNYKNKNTCESLNQKDKINKLNAEHRRQIDKNYRKFNK